MNFCCKIDDREDGKRIESAMKFFNENGVQTKQTRLPVGDYLFNDKLVFEWKTPSDFVSSIMDRRIFKQTQRMRQYPFSYIIIVGNVYQYLKISILLGRKLL